MSKQNRHLDSALGLNQRCHVAIKNEWDCTETAVYAVPICPLTKKPCVNDLPIGEEDDEIWHPPSLGPLDIFDPRSVNHVYNGSAHSTKRILVSAARNYLLADL